MCDLVGDAGLVDGAHRIAAADDGDGGGIGCDGLGNGVGADGELWKFKNSRGAVPDDGLSFGDDSFNRGDGFGADVEALPISRKISGAVPGLGVGVWREVVGKNVVDGEQKLNALGFGLVDGFTCDLDLVFFNQALAGGDAKRALEGVSHATDDDQGVDLVEQIVDDVDFAGDFGAADDGDEGMLGRLKRLAEVGNFFFHQQAGDGGLQEVRDAFRGSVGAMRGAECVVDVNFCKRGELLRELGVIGFFFGVVAEILKQQNLAGLKLARHFAGDFTDAIRREGDIDLGTELVVEQADAGGRRPGAANTLDSACPWDDRGEKRE